MKEQETTFLNEQNNSIKNYMIDLLIMITAPAVVAIYHYGSRSFLIILLSVITAVACEASLDLIHKRRPKSIADLSAVFTGIAIALMLPASSPLWLAPVGSAFAIYVVKMPFGKAKDSLFVPAAAAIAFLSLTYKTLVFTYPSLNVDMPELVVGSEGFVEGNSLAYMLSHSTSIGTSVLNILDLCVGKVAGPMGTPSLFVMFGLLLYMLIRRSSEWITSASFLAACSILSVIFPRVLSGRSISLLMELSAGMLFFAAIFLISDPVTSPKGQMARVLYGFVGGIITMLFRYMGAFEEGVCFVVLILNALSTSFERAGEKLEKRINTKKAKKAKADKPEKPAKKEKVKNNKPANIEKTKTTNKNNTKNSNNSKNNKKAKKPKKQKTSPKKKGGAN